MITFDKVLKSINEYAECSAKSLIHLILNLFLFVGSLAVFLNVMIYRAFNTTNLTVPIFIVLYLLVFYTIANISKNKDTYDFIRRWQRVMIILTIMLFVSVLVIILLF